MVKQDSPPAWPQEAYRPRPPPSTWSCLKFCREILSKFFLGVGGGDPSSVTFPPPLKNYWKIFRNFFFSGPPHPPLEVAPEGPPPPQKFRTRDPPQQLQKFRTWDIPPTQTVGHLVAKF